MAVKKRPKDNSSLTGSSHPVTNSHLSQWGWLIPLLLALLVNFGVLSNGFVWDDELISQNFQSRTTWWKGLLPETGDGTLPKSSHPYFRPMVSASYQLDAALFGPSPFGFHLSLWLMHALNSALVFLLTRSLLNTNPIQISNPHHPRPTLSPIPLFASSLFAVHPIHAEAVAWIAGRTDVLCTVFLLASFWLYVRGRQSDRILLTVLSMALFVMALFTKEAAVGFFLLFPLYEHVVSQPNSTASRRFRSMAIGSIIPLILLFTYIWVRISRIDSPFGGSSWDTLFSLSSLVRLISAFGLYLKLLLFPFPHLPFIPTVPQSGLWSLFSIFGLLLTGGSLMFAIYQRSLLPAIGLGWMAVTLAPAVFVSVIRVATTPAAERYLYAPSVGFLIFMVWIMFKGIEQVPILSGFRRETWITAAIIGILLVTGWSWGSWNRNRTWKNQTTFWEAAVTAAPDAGYAHGELAIQYIKEGKYEQGEKELFIALEKPNTPQGHIDALSNMGSFLTIQKRYQEAESHLQKALVLGPGNDKIYWHLAELYFAMSVQEKNPAPGRKENATYNPRLFKKAEIHLEEALRLRPLLQLNLEAGWIYYRFGKWDKAEYYFAKVLNNSPNQHTPFALSAQEGLDRIKTTPVIH